MSTLLEEYGDVVIAILCGSVSIAISTNLLPVIKNYIEPVLTAMMG